MASSSNGRDITADDVKYSLNGLLNPATNAPTAFMFTDIAGTKEFQDGTRRKVSGIKSLTPRLSHSPQHPSFGQSCSVSPASRLHVAKEGVEAAGKQFGFKPLGRWPLHGWRIRRIAWQTG